MQWGTTLRNTWLDSIETVMGTGALLKFYDGTLPANCAAAADGTLICTITCPSDYFSDAASGIKAKTGTWSGSCVATGTISYVRFYDSTGTTCHWQGAVSEAVQLVTASESLANSNQLEFADTTGVEVGQAVAGNGIETGTTVLAVTSTIVTLSISSTAGVASGATISFGDVSGDTLLNTATVGSVGQTITIGTMTIQAPGA